MFMKNSALFLGTLVAAASAPQAAFANAAIVRDFKAQAQVLPRKAINAGYQRFGALDLYDLVNRLQQGEVNVRVVGQVAHKQPLGGPIVAERDGAQWTAGSVAVSGSQWPRTRAQNKPMLALHEVLGAMRIEDDNFGCSGTLWALTDNNVRSTMSREELATFEGYAHTACQMARGGNGGSTGVTGGGDEYNVAIRQTIMDTGLSNMRSASTREERDAAFQQITGSFYQGYGINKRKKRFTEQDLSLNRIVLGRRPYDDEIIRVFEDLEMTQEIPQNAKHGWTYDARTNTVHIHGRYQRKRTGAMGMSPGVLITRAR